MLALRSVRNDMLGLVVFFHALFVFAVEPALTIAAPSVTYEWPPLYLRTAERADNGELWLVDLMSSPSASLVGDDTRLSLVDDRAPLPTGSAALAIDEWSAFFTKWDGWQRSTSTKITLDWAAFSTSLAWRDDDPLDPTPRTPWETNESLRLPVAGPLFVFGQFGATAPIVEQTLPRWESKYGVGVKLKPWLVDEVQVRGGPALRSDEAGRPLRPAGSDHSELFLEAVTRIGLPIVGPVNFECVSTAAPPAIPGERSLVNQDFKLARPLARGGNLHVGAKYRWEDSPGATPWVERTQLYLGMELKR